MSHPKAGDLSSLRNIQPAISTLHGVGNEDFSFEGKLGHSLILSKDDNLDCIEKLTEKTRKKKEQRESRNLRNIYPLGSDRRTRKQKSGSKIDGTPALCVRSSRSQQ